MNNTTKRLPNGYWGIYENNYKEAKKYKSKSEFKNGCSRAYHVARKNSWLDNYTWFTEKQKPSGYWTYETCYQEAKNYNSRSEFQKGCGSAYIRARKEGWLDNYTWFTEKKQPSGYWNYETCYQEAKNYNSRTEFAKGCASAYHVALKNGWLDNYTWFEKDLNPYKNKRDNVYCYIFIELNSIYIGRTIDINKRNTEHNTKTNSAVYKFAQKHNIVIPQITILETNLSLEQGREKEHFYVTKYKSEGWNVLNKAKTGENCGSLGSLGGGKWNKKTCYQEAKKYNSRKEFEKGCGSAYIRARKERWLDNYTWFSEKQKPSGHWDIYENNYNEALRYKSRSEFRKGCSRAYEVARQKGWLDNYTWFSVSKTAKKWNYETCYQEALKYKSRSEFVKSNGSAYQIACKNGWLDNYTWFTEKQKPSGYWTYETCYQEAKNYKSRSKFAKGCSSAHIVALKKGWLDIFFPKA